MLGASLALVLMSQRIGATAGGPPPPLFSFEIADMPSRIITDYSVHRGRGDQLTPHRIDRWTRRGDEPGSRESLRLDECPEVRPLLERATRLALPSPALARIRALDGSGPRDLVWYELRGVSRTGSNELGLFVMTAVERRGAEPSVLARWGLDVADAFQTCLDRRGPTPSTPEAEFGDA